MKLTNSGILILSLVQQPTHGYAINVTARKLGVNLTHQFIYRALKSFELAGLVETIAQPVVDNRLRIAYTLTPLGRTRLENAEPSLAPANAVTIEDLFVLCNTPSIQKACLRLVRERLAELCESDSPIRQYRIDQCRATIDLFENTIGEQQHESDSTSVHRRETPCVFECETNRPTRRAK